MRTRQYHPETGNAAPARHYRHAPAAHLSGVLGRRGNGRPASLRPYGLLLLLLACPCQAQVQNFCDLKEITVEPLSNAVVIRIKATGLLNFTMGDWDLWAPDSSGRWRLKPLSRIVLRLTNVRPGTASTQDIGIYPVSHIVCAAPSESRDSVGLTCTLVLFRPAYLAYLQIPDNSWDQTNSWRYAGPQVMVMRTRAQNEAMIIVTSDRAYQAPPEHYSGENRALDVGGTADRLSLQATNADLVVVAQKMSALTGAAIFVHDNAQRYVSASLRDMPLEPMLQALAAGYGLSVSRQEGAYYMTAALPDNAASYYAAEQRRIPLRYLQAADAPDLLATPMLRYVRPESGMNSVIATGPPAILDKVARDLAVLDQPAPHCRLRVWLIGVQGRDERVREVLANFSGGTTRAAVEGTKNLSVETGADSAYALLTQLRALATRQQVRIMALPSLEVANGEEAELFVGTRVYYFRLAGRRTQEMRLDSIQAGSRLFVQPRTAGEEITAYVAAESSAVLPSNSLGPRVQRYSVDAQVRLGSGRCILIGGLTLSGEEWDAGRLGVGRPLTALFDETARSGEITEVWMLVEGRARLAEEPAPARATEARP